MLPSVGLLADKTTAEEFTHVGCTSSFLEIERERGEGEREVEEEIYLPDDGHSIQDIWFFI